MSIRFVWNDQTMGSIGPGATRMFLSITRLIQAELGGIPCGLSPIVSDEIWIDRDCFVRFVDTFFEQAERDGKYRYFGYWAQEVAGMYESITGSSVPRTILNVGEIQPIRYL